MEYLNLSDDNLEFQSSIMFQVTVAGVRWMTMLWVIITTLKTLDPMHIDTIHIESTCRVKIAT